MRLASLAMAVSPAASFARWSWHTASTNDLPVGLGNVGTYPALLGVEGAQARAVALIDDGCRALERVGLLTPTLERIARFTVERTS